jgi:hypothetical protein
MLTNAHGKRIQDTELLHQIERARGRKCLNDPQGGLHAPIEDDPGIKPYDSPEPPERYVK